MIPDLRSETARRAAQDNLIGQHVERVAAMELCHADHQGIEWVYGTAGQRLQCRDDGGACNDRVLALMRHGRMGAAAIDRDLEDVRSGHRRSGIGDDFANRKPGPVVHSVNALHRKAFEQAFIDHDLSAAGPFFRRLENEIGSAGEITRRRKVFRGTQQHCHMAVVAAGVHLSGHLGAVGDIGLFLHGQGVHVGTQTDGTLAVAVAFQHADDTGPGKAAHDLDTEFLQVARHKVRGPMFLERDLGVGMDIPPPGDHVLVKCVDILRLFHKRSPSNDAE